MDLVAGAKQLADLFDERGVPAESAPSVETGAPIFRWLGIEPPGEPEPSE